MARQSGPVAMQNAATATGAGTSILMAGYNRAMFQVSGTFVATITFQATVDGTNYVTYALSDLSTSARTHNTTQTTPGIFIADDASGITAIRANITAYTSGSITVVGLASE
jgi:hypothetical protein